MSSASAATWVHGSGWVLVASGAALAVVGLWWTYRAVRIENDDPTLAQMMPRLVRTARAMRDRMNRLLGRSRSVNVDVVGATAEVRMGAPRGSMFAMTLRPVAEDDGLEVKVATLLHNFDQLRVAVKHWDGLVAERLQRAEQMVDGHDERLAAIDSRIAAAEASERARRARSLPHEVGGLLLAGVGQVLGLAGAVLIAL